MGKKLVAAERQRRLQVANSALPLFTVSTQLEWHDGSGVHVRWRVVRPDQELVKRWQTRDGSCYPTWYNHWAHGGTCCVALAQLVRWVQGVPTVPIHSWQRWTEPGCALARERGAELVRLLVDGGWPEAKCVLCQRRLSNKFDWWSLRGVTGPCCAIYEGCKQQPPDQENT